MHNSQGSPFLHHETKHNTLVKFMALCVIVLGYFLYISSKFGTQDGIIVTVLTWSFFVFCTPVADAGFLLAFPVRLLLKVRMMYTQLASFVIAFFLNLYTYILHPKVYSKTVLLSLFKQILDQPIPFWGIILLSIVGTLFSIYFGDELIDVAKHSERQKYHKHKATYKIVIAVFVVALTLVLYDILLKRLGVDIPL